MIGKGCVFEARVYSSYFNILLCSAKNDEWP